MRRRIQEGGPDRIAKRFLTSTQLSTVNYQLSTVIKRAPRAAAAGVALEPSGSRRKPQTGPSGFPLDGGHAHRPVNIGSLLVQHRLRDITRLANGPGDTWA